MKFEKKITWNKETAKTDLTALTDQGFKLEEYQNHKDGNFIKVSKEIDIETLDKLIKYAQLQGWVQ